MRQRALNEAEKRLGGTARYGVNKFSDLTPEEFQSMSDHRVLISFHGCIAYGESSVVWLCKPTLWMQHSCLK